MWKTLALSLVPMGAAWAQEAPLTAETAPAAPAAVEPPPPTTPEGVTRTLWNSVLDLVRDFVQHLPEIGMAVIIILLTALAARLVLRASCGVLHRLRLKDSLRDLFSQLIYIGVWTVGLLLAAGLLFPGFGFAQIVATAGLASIAIGFAFKDIFENFFAGILILWNYPFEIGDYIEVEGENIEGKVEDIWVRISLIRQTDGELVIVPNSKLYTNAVRVLTNCPLRRLTIICGVAYGEDVDESREVIRAAVEKCRTVSKDKPIQIFAQEFAESSINFEVTWWTGSTPLQHRESRDEVVAAVKRALDQAGIEIPFPYRTLTFKREEPLVVQRADGHN